MARPAWDTPIAVRPNGSFVYASQVRRVRFGRRVRFVVELIAFVAMLVSLFFIGTFVGPMPA
jgi:hypothetical protein